MHAQHQRGFRKLSLLALAGSLSAGCSTSADQGEAAAAGSPAASSTQATAPIQAATAANMSAMTAAAGPTATSTPGLASMAMAKTMSETAPAPGAAGAGAAGTGVQQPDVPVTNSGAAGNSAAGSGGSITAAGSGGATAAVAGGGGAAGSTPAQSTGADECGEDAKPVMDGTPREQGHGNTNLRTSGDVAFTYIKGTMTVPMDPTPTRGTLFLWPGLQPLQMDQTVGYGVLQPVLSWGTSCADTTRVTYDGWWISGVYVGTTPGSWTNISCHGGDTMDVEPGDKLDYVMALEGTVWKQTVTNQSNGKSVTFPYDLKGQKQQWLLHQIELKGSTKPVDDFVFTDVVAKLSDAQPKACVPSETGANDYYSPPLVSADGKTCCFSKIILRASGIKATSPDEP